MRRKSPHKKVRMYKRDCFEWLGKRDNESIHAIIADPPYGLVEYTEKEQRKLRNGKGGVWRIPPSFDGCQRSPVPRFTTLTTTDLDRLYEFFECFGKKVLPVLVPGAHVLLPRIRSLLTLWATLWRLPAWRIAALLPAW